MFEVASQRYPLDERAATLMAENLRVKAAHEPGAEGTEGARPVADAIELRLIEDTDDPITSKTLSERPQPDGDALSLPRCAVFVFPRVD